jgi:hypothetical protein
MSEKGTYSDPRCYACMPADEAMGVTATVTVKHYRTSGREPDIDNAMTVTIPEWLVKGAANPEGWREVDGVALPPITWAERGRIEGSYNRFADRIAEAINKRIPGPDVNNDVLRKARSE